MPGKLHHEQLSRGSGEVDRLANVRLTICGAGALGSHLADTLARQGFQRLRVIDHDRIEEHNVSTQLYGESDVGGSKVEVLRSLLFRSVGIEIDVVRKELDARNVRKLLKDSDVVLDAFDNSASRQIVQDHCRAAGTACLHIGLFADYGEVIWDEHYRVPSDAAGDVCDYPLARNLVLLTVSVAAETLVRAILEGVHEDWSITLCDFAIRPMEGPSPREFFSHAHSAQMSRRRLRIRWRPEHPRPFAGCWTCRRSRGLTERHSRVCDLQGRHRAILVRLPGRSFPLPAEF
jgi:molybdopterin/thiamine biosynthesis adenylyltransferase